MMNCSAAPWSCTDPIATSPGPSSVIVHRLGGVTVPTLPTNCRGPPLTGLGELFGTDGPCTLTFRVPPGLGGRWVGPGEAEAGDSCPEPEPGAGDPWPELEPEPGAGDPWPEPGAGDPWPEPEPEPGAGDRWPEPEPAPGAGDPWPEGRAVAGAPEAVEAPWYLLCWLATHPLALTRSTTAVA